MPDHNYRMPLHEQVRELEARGLPAHAARMALLDVIAARERYEKSGIARYAPASLRKRVDRASFNWWYHWWKQLVWYLRDGMDEKVAAHIDEAIARVEPAGVYAKTGTEKGAKDVGKP